jgi:putative chitinase
MQFYGIASNRRQAAFLAQIAIESCHLIYVKEIWGPTDAQKGYEGRADLGNNQAGDGERFMGRGLIQITGRTNYQAVENALCLDCVDHPELLEQPANAATTAAWWWSTHGLNALADGDQFTDITRRINGGLTGIDARMAQWAAAKAALGVS